jgi:hypothetical protein
MQPLDNPIATLEHEGSQRLGIAPGSDHALPYPAEVPKACIEVQTLRLEKTSSP